MNQANSSNLPALLQSIGPRGGLSLFESDAFMQRDSAEEIIKKCNVTNTEQLMSVILMVHAFGKAEQVEYLLQSGLILGLLTKSDITNLYLMQNESTRLYGPILTFSKMARISQFAFPRQREGEHIVPKNWITRDEMLALANRVISVSLDDLYTIFQQWFYRTEVEIPLSKEFFAYWWKITGDAVNNVDGKIASLLAIAYQKKYPEKVSLEETVSRFRRLSLHHPESHGIFRYLSLCFWIAGENETNKQEVVNAWTQQIEDMICGGKSLFRGAQMSIEFFICERGISEEMKTAALTKINRTAVEVAKSYTNLVADAKRNVDDL